MHPVGAAAAEAAGDALTKACAVARANILLGLAMAVIALVATINPGGFYAQAQIIEHAATAPAPEAQQCATTEAEALDIRGTALLLALKGLAQVLLLMGLAQALTMAAMALVAAISGASPSPAPVPGAQAQQCAATDAEALDMRGSALILVLTGLVQALLAKAAHVALVGSLRAAGGCLSLTALAQLITVALNANFLSNVLFRGVVDLAFGDFAPGQYLGDFAVGYALLAVSYAALLGVSLAVRPSALVSFASYLYPS